MLTESRPADCDLLVVENSGCAATEWKHLNANLGVSFSKTRYFSKAMMSCYVRWIAERFDRLLIVVADHPEAYNAQVFKQLSFEEARRRSLEYGRQLQTAYRRAIPGAVSDRISIRLASDIMTDEPCRALIRRIEAAAESHPRFRCDVQRSVEEALSEKLAHAAEAGVDAADQAQTLSKYLIEELAIVLYLNHLAPVRYPLMVVPHFIPSILPKLYSAPYAELFSDITQGERFRSMKLVAASQQRAVQEIGR